MRITWHLDYEELGHGGGHEWIAVRPLAKSVALEASGLRNARKEARMRWAEISNNPFPRVSKPSLRRQESID